MQNVLREGASYLLFLYTLSFFIFNYIYIDKSKFITVVLSSVALYAVIKVGFFLIIFLGVISPLDAYELLDSYAPGVVVTSVVEDQLPRITTANDYLLPVFTSWLLYEQKYGNIGKYTFRAAFFLGIFLIILTLSRYLYGFFILSTIIFLLLNRNIKVILTYIFSFVLLLSIIFMFLYKIGYSEIIIDRFFGKSAQSSDAIKKAQWTPIISLMENAPIIGNGFGVALNLFRKDMEQSYQIELQVPLFFGKIGFLGMGLICIILVYLLLKIALQVQQSINDRLFILSLFVLWLLGGFFNPVLLLTNTTINYLLIYTMTEPRDLILSAA